MSMVGLVGLVSIGRPRQERSTHAKNMPPSVISTFGCLSTSTSQRRYRRKLDCDALDQFLQADHTRIPSTVALADDDFFRTRTVIERPWALELRAAKPTTWMDFNGSRAWGQPIGPLSALEDRSRYALQRTPTSALPVQRLCGSCSRRSSWTAAARRHVDGPWNPVVKHGFLQATWTMDFREIRLVEDVGVEVGAGFTFRDVEAETGRQLKTLYSGKVPPLLCSRDGRATEDRKTTTQRNFGGGQPKCVNSEATHSPKPSA